MGQKSSRRQHLNCPSTSSSFTPNDIKTQIETVKPSYPFRCEKREAIPDALIEGPFEDFEIATDVYATAYLVARNATPEMYSFSPFTNPQVRIVWAYLLFIVFSQLFVILSITLWYPPSVNTSTVYVDCANTSSFAVLRKRGFLLDAHSPEDCQVAGGSEVSFVADAYGAPRKFYKIEQSVPFYDAVLTEGSFGIYLLRIVCCAWVFSQVYLECFESVTSLLEYHDFSSWFIPLKGQTISNSWAVCFPLLQFSIMLVVTIVSFVMICSMGEAFDIVLNSLAFTFINEVGRYFNTPLAKHLGATEIQLIKPCDYSINYLYPEYRLDNAVNPDGSYTDEGWYILEEEQKAGLLSDYKVRHNSKTYDHPSESLIKFLGWILIVMPPSAVVVGALRSHWVGSFNLTAVGDEL